MESGKYWEIPLEGAGRRNGYGQSGYWTYDVLMTADV